MSWLNNKVSGMSQGARAVAAIALVAIGAAGGASAASLTRPAIEMAPIVATPAAKLAAATGIVSVKGRIAEVYGDRFVVEDGSGRAMIDAGRENGVALAKGTAITVQGRFDDGQLRASFITTADGEITQVGPRGRHGHSGKEHPPRDRREEGAPPPPTPPAFPPAAVPAAASKT
ncbi:MAG: hypothetical protein Q7T68_17540 [Sphingopyxis sp.]|nr:hypothetical protein [Sphingopyxis sp.]